MSEPPSSIELPSIESTGGESFRFEGRDGTRLRGAHWPPSSQPPAAGPAGTVLLLNGRTEFIEKTLEPVGELRRRGFAVWTLDWRGQGLSQRPLANRQKGHVEDFQLYLDDLALLLDRRMSRDLRRPLMMLGHSMGGHIGLRCLHDRPDDFAGALFSAPMVGIATPPYQRPIRGLLGWLGGLPPFGETYAPGGEDYGPNNRVFAGNPLTGDPERFARFHAQIDRNPELALGGPTLGWLHAALASIEILNRRGYAEAIRTPVVIASAGGDTVVDTAAMTGLAARLPMGRLETVAGARHELMIEIDAQRESFWALFDRLRNGLAA